MDLIIWVFLGSFDLGFWGFWRIWRIWGFCGFCDFEDLVILRIWGFCGFGDLWIWRFGDLEGLEDLEDLGI